MVDFHIRPAVPGDASFLAEMLIEASNWNGQRARSRVELLDDPHINRYVRGWKRPSDDGVVAEDAQHDPIGACWFRVLPQTEPGYGFVASGVPELSLGVRPIWRAQGVGRSLLQAAVALATRAGHQRISLSVERANFAHRLYVSERFVTVESGADADTMVRTLR